DEDREIAQTAECAGARDRRRIDDAQYEVIPARSESGPGCEIGAFARGADQDGAGGGRGALDDPRVHGVDAEADGDDPEPDNNRRDRILDRDEAEAPGPERCPERERGGERAAPEQAGRIAPPVAGTVVPGDDEAEHESDGVLPAIQVTGGEEAVHGLADPVAE